jgi:hypothetical protein
MRQGAYTFNYFFMGNRYFFISAAVLLFGAELNSAIAREPDEPIEQE